MPGFQRAALATSNQTTPTSSELSVGNPSGIRPICAGIDAGEISGDENVEEEEERGVGEGVERAERREDHGEEDEEESPEVRRVRSKKSPRAPTKDEYDQHIKSGHLPFRSWCRHCVAGRADRQPRLGLSDLRLLALMRQPVGYYINKTPSRAPPRAETQTEPQVEVDTMCAKSFQRLECARLQTSWV